MKNPFLLLVVCMMLRGLEKKELRERRKSKRRRRGKLARDPCVWAWPCVFQPLVFNLWLDK